MSADRCGAARLAIVAAIVGTFVPRSSWHRCVARPAGRIHSLCHPPDDYVSFHGGRYSRRRNSFGSVIVPPDPLIVLVTRMLAPS